MKKIFISLTALLLLIVAIPFTSIGQNLILIPVVNRVLSQKIENHKIELKELKPSINTLEMRMILDDMVELFTTGPIDWFSLKFKFKYLITSDEIRLNSQMVSINMDVKGSLVGTPDNIAVYGAGYAFGASLKYDFKLINSSINSIRTVIKNAKVKEILALTKQPPLADGRLNLIANLSSLDLKNPEGSAIVEVKDGVLNMTLLSKILRVKLPKRKDFLFNGRFRVKNRAIRGEALFDTPIITLKATDLISTIDFRKVRGSYKAEIPDLSYLNNLIGQPLRGEAEVHGEVYYDRKNSVVQLLAKSNSFGGESKIFYNSDKLKVRLLNVELKKIAYTLNTPPIFRSGIVTIKANIESLKSLKGAYSIKSKGRLSREVVKKEYQFDPIEEIFLLKSAGSIKKGVVYSKNSLKTPSINLLLNRSRYIIAGGGFDGMYSLKVAKIDKFSSWIGTELKGGVSTRGKITLNPLTKALRVVGESKSFGGVVRYDYRGKELNLRLKSVNGVKVLRFLGQKKYFRSSSVDASFTFQDVKNLTGVFNVSSKGELSQKVIRDLNGIDLGSNLSYRLSFRGNIISHKLSSKATLSTTVADLNLQPLNYDLKSKRFIGEYRLNIPNLLRLKSILQQKYYGQLALQGQFWNDEVFHLTGSAKKWQGDIKFRLNGNLLKVNLKDAQMVDIFQTLGYEPLLIGRANASLKYNIDTQEGLADIQTDRTTLVQNSLVKVLDLLIRKNLSTEIFNSAILRSKVSKELVSFDFNMKSNKHEIDIKGGKIDRKRERVDALVTIYDGPKPYKARLKGKLKKPKLIPIVTRELQERAIKEVGRLLKKGKIEPKKIIPKDIRDRFKDLF
jgi:hypothetical protein